MKKIISILLLAVITPLLSACTTGRDNLFFETSENRQGQNSSLSLKMQKIAEAPDQELLDDYINGLELAMPNTFTFQDPKDIPSDMLVRLFMYSLDTTDEEKYAGYETRWFNAEDGQFHVPLADIKEQLDTILEHYNLITSEIYSYSSKENAVVMPTITGFGGAVWTKLKNKLIDGDLLVLTVDIFKDDTLKEVINTKQYTIRFYEDGYKCLSIISLNEAEEIDA